MTKPVRSRFFRNAATLTIISFALNGCMIDDDKSDEETATDNEVTGSVGDGPIIGATLRILRNDGVALKTLESDSNAGYNVKVRARGKYYPLLIEAHDGTDIVTNAAPDFHLLSAVIEPGKKSVANVNPFSTFAVEIARELPGGADKVNLATAQEMVSSELNNGLASLATRGAMSTKIDSSNVAEIVRASEALGETVRRTRDALSASGYSSSGSSVLQTLSSDLTDNVIDGNGGSRADARHSAVWTIVSAQVLLETMANELHVYGSDATQLMSNAIDLVSVGTARPSLAELTATGAMIEKARVGLVAAYEVTSDTGIADLLTAMDDIRAGSGSSTIRNSTLPGDYRSRLDSAVALVAGGSDAVLATVNDISRSGRQAIDTTPAATTGSVTLNWNAPTQNEDGSALTDLAGYKIYWGTTPGNYPDFVTIDGANETTYVVENLPFGTYEFVATSFNTSGVESDYSSPSAKVVQ